MSAPGAHAASAFTVSAQLARRAPQHGMLIASMSHMSTYHAAVWLDHNEARIFHITKTTFDEKTIQSDTGHTQLHRKSGSDDGHRAKENQTYYHDVIQALGDAEEILVVGPATAKLELIKHAHRHDPMVEAKIIGVETVDHPSDGQLVAYMRKYFKEADLKNPS